VNDKLGARHYTDGVRTVGILAALTAAMMLAGCAHQIYGIYAGDLDLGQGHVAHVELEFLRNDTVVVRGGIPDTMLGRYRVEDDKVVVVTPNETDVLRIVDQDTLKMGSNGEIQVLFHHSAEAKGR
jgi:hypothetical protein